ncbi:hypothetical protein BC936DRAFT_144281 [Jimgerdemannia flammicorona]|uniref:Tc1-like transposase DDE domain-containing protein n=1 Tax=Jimgerdemannia flammicorona TaxID=994334 RepID=A0A432ZYA0_9FUNG|nr:hypothetical protein BC936DRAFT_144281 [Jimgerdemannia flammicorona]
MIAHIKTLNYSICIILYKIAKYYRHIVIKTPLYYCKLQPIEQVWDIVKNQIIIHPNPQEIEVYEGENEIEFNSDTEESDAEASNSESTEVVMKSVEIAKHGDF